MKAAVDMAGRGFGPASGNIQRLGGRLNERGQVYPSEKMASEIVTELIQQVKVAIRSKFC